MVKINVLFISDVATVAPTKRTTKLPTVKTPGPPKLTTMITTEEAGGMYDDAFLCYSFIKVPNYFNGAMLRLVILVRMTYFI